MADKPVSGGRGPIVESLIVAAVVLLGCEIGIHSRVLLDLASIWPANAMLLAILILRPSANRPATWVLSAAAYLLADMLAGTDFGASLLLNGGNLLAVSAGLVAARLAPADTFALEHPVKVAYVVLIMGFAATAGGVGGMVVGPLAFGLGPSESFVLWGSSEYVNLALILPAATMLTLSRGAVRLFSKRPEIALRQAWALTFLAASVLCASLLGGPGAMALPLPALIWCAVQFRPAASSLIAAICCTWFLIAVPYGWLPIGYDLEGVANASSFRVGVAMILVAQFAVAGVNAAWRNANSALRYAADHDGLTGISNRSRFIRKTGERLLALGPDQTACLLMIDIDRFKAINDDLGHPVGDLVITSVARALAAEARENDVVGRLGGEEFAMLLLDLGPTEAHTAAERMCRIIRELEISLPDGDPVHVTISIGARLCRQADSLSDALSEADSALYAAKRTGRDRVVCASELVKSQQAAALAFSSDVAYSPPIRSAGG